MPTFVRRNLCSDWKLCFKCGKKGHFSTKCLRDEACSHCNQNHDSVLHVDKKGKPESMNNHRTEASFKATTEQLSQVSLKTITIKISNPTNNKSVLANCLLDSGNSTALLSRKCADQLNLKEHAAPFRVKGVGGTERVYNSATSAEIWVEGVKNGFAALITTKIVEDPAGDLLAEDWNKSKDRFEFMKDIEIYPRAADGKIDILLGCDTPCLLSSLEEIASDNSKTVLLKTKFGWTALGATSPLATQVQPESTNSYLIGVPLVESQLSTLHPTRNPKPSAADKPEKDISAAIQQLGSSAADKPEKGTSEATQSLGSSAVEIPEKGTSEITQELGASAADTPEKSISVADGKHHEPAIHRVAEASEYAISNKEIAKIEDLISKTLWEVSDKGEDKVLSAEEIYALDTMIASRKKVGAHYEISALWKKGCPTLKNNLPYALARLRGLNRLKRFTPDVRDRYEEVFDSWISKGYLEELHPNRRFEEETWILPHFPVLRDDKPTSKIRPVIDSPAEYRGQSLNQQCSAGPNLLCNLGIILLRFRRHPISLGMDLREMFLNIKLDPKSRRYHRLLWRTREGKLRLFQFLVHTYGNPGSPAVANFHLQSIAKENKHLFPVAANTIVHSTLMDDTVDSFPDQASAEQVLKDLQTLFSKAGMSAHKFVSNNPSVLNLTASEDRAQSLTIIPDSKDSLPEVKILGVRYSSRRDIFTFDPIIPPKGRITRQLILKTFPRIFDPLGFIQPHILVAKKIFQDATALKLDWKEAVPEHIELKWRRWLQETDHLPDVTVPRCTRQIVSNPTTTDTIHIFMDGSETGYCAVAYRCTSVASNANGGTLPVFLMSKAKVAPLRTQSVPRLELLAAELGLKIFSDIKKAHGLKDTDCFFWSDSKDVLDWLKAESRKLQRFVAHRIAKLQDLTPVQNWNHVESELNPADIGSRGLALSSLLESNLWWKGPDFIKHFNTSVVYKESHKASETTLFVKPLAHKKPKLQLAVSDRLHPANFSSLNRFLRVLSHIRRLFRKGKPTERKAAADNSEKEKSAEISEEEYVEAEHLFIEFIQDEAFDDLKSQIQKKGRANFNSKFMPYFPTIDNTGVIRLNGRIEKSKKIPYSSRSPILVPNNYAARLIMEDIHGRNQEHMLGQEALLAAFTDRFFMLGARTLARSVCHSCVQCRRLSSKPPAIKMGPLPDFRLGNKNKREEMFQSCQLDCSGHYLTKEANQTTKKRWLLIIVCNIYKAVHIEVLDSMDTSSFLLALQRMMVRRGQISRIYCDRGSNLQGSSTALKDLLNSVSFGKCREKFPYLEWDFAPPKTPHRQGLAEATMKSAKRALAATMQSAVVSHEELRTLAVSVEAALNSRPITYVYDATQPRPIRAQDFMGVNQIQRVYGCNFADVPLGRRWRAVNRKLDAWWAKFMADLIPTLHRVPKWRKSSTPIGAGDIVVVLDKKNGFGKWPIGKVVETHPSMDGTPRTISVLLNGKIVQRSGRSVAKL